MHPKKILIVGNSGSGKTTLAQTISAKHDITAIHLDHLQWAPKWQERPSEIFKQDVQDALDKHDSWVVDGAHSDALDIVIPQADAILYLDLPPLLCLWRVMTRTVKHFNKEHAGLAPGCKEQQISLDFYRYILSFDRLMKPALEDKINQHGKDVRYLSSQNDFTSYLENMTLD